MKQGLTYEEAEKRIKRESKLKDDLIFDCRSLTMLGGNELSMKVDEEQREYAISQVAHRQLGTFLKVPASYYDRLKGELPALLDRNVNELLRHTSEQAKDDEHRRLLRTFGGKDPILRAFLSTRYRFRDNDELWGHLLPILGELPDVQFESMAITDTNFYIKAVTPRTEGVVSQGDIVQAGVVIRNSEVGHGSLRVAPMIYRLVCTNGMIAPEAVGEGRRFYHVGREMDSDEAFRVFRPETLELEDKVFFAKLADVVRAAVDEAQFAAIVDQMRDAKRGQKLVKPLEAMERVTKRFDFSQDESESIMNHLIEGSDLSAYGVMNAITRAAQDVESYDRATELEMAGGRVLALAGTPEWTALAA